MKKNEILYLETGFLLLALAWVIISFFLSPVEDKSMWFARSGAIMILLAVIVEYHLTAKHKKIISRATVAAGIGLPMRANEPKKNRIIGILAHLFVIIGTIIWAYGDIIHKLLLQIIHV